MECRNMNVKGTAGKSSEGNEEHIFGTQKKREPSYTVAESLAELCPSRVKSRTYKQWTWMFS